MLRRLSHRAQPLRIRYDVRRDIVVVARAVHVDTFAHRLIVTLSGSAMRELQPAPYTPRPETIPPFRCGTPHATTLLLFSRERDSTRSRSRQSQCAALCLSIRRLIVASDLLPRTPRYSTPAVAPIGGPAGLVPTALLLIDAVRVA